MNKKNPKKIVIQAVKASRKQSRDEEIKTYGKLLNFKKIAVSKKVYDRKKLKADCQKDNLPSFKCTSRFLSQNNFRTLEIS